MCDGERDQSGSDEWVVFAKQGVGVPPHLAGVAAADSERGSDFVRCRTDATGPAATAGGGCGSRHRHRSRRLPSVTIVVIMCKLVFNVLAGMQE